MTLSKVRIGVYGASGSGKTTFFRQMVQGNALPLAPGTKLAQFMASTAAPDGRVLPTTASIENMEIKIDRVSYWVGDAKGADQSLAVDMLDMVRWQEGKRNPIARQIDRSNAFLFFFDPTAQDHPDRRLKHHREELLRAKQLIDYILESRQNRLLPVLFIITHQDLLRRDAVLQEQTEKWVDEVDDYLDESYAEILIGHFPRPLVRKEYLFHRVASIEPQGTTDLPGILEKARSMAELVEQFRYRDRQRSWRFVFAFILCTLLVLFLPIVCLTSPAAKDLLLKVRKQAAPVFSHLPSLSGSLSDESSAMSESSIDLNPLFQMDFDWELKTIAALNRSLFLLMKRLNKLEDSSQDQTEDYQSRLDLWTKAIDELNRRFDAEQADTSQEKRDKLDRFSKILPNLTDSPKRSGTKLNDLLKKYWQLYRETLIELFRSECSLQQAAGSSSSQILDVLCQAFERSFRDVSESLIRGDGIDKPFKTPAFEQNLKGLNNTKDSLKQDLRMSFIACRNYQDGYPVEIRILSVKYESISELNRDYDYRLAFDGKKERSEIYVDLSISAGFQNQITEFLPARKDISLSFLLEKPLNLGIQRKMKGNEGQWEKFVDWEIRPKTDWNTVSLQMLGVPFYLRFENEENTSYQVKGQGFDIALILRRPRFVPEILWEIAESHKTDWDNVNALGTLK